MLGRCAMNIRRVREWEYLDFADLKVLTISPKVKKEIVSKLGKLFNDVSNLFCEQETLKS